MKTWTHFILLAACLFLASTSASLAEQDLASTNIRIMDPNSAEFVGLANETDTLTPGKLADIVLVEGNPLENIQTLLNVKFVLKISRIVADYR